MWWRHTYTIFGVAIGAITLFITSWLFYGDHCRDQVLPDVFVATAFHIETDALRAQTDVMRFCRSGGVRYEVRTHASGTFVLFETGVGPAKAAATTARTLTRFPVSAIIMIGTAGSLDSRFAVGDVVAPIVWVDLSTGNEYAVDEALYRSALAVAGLQGVPLGATSATFIDDPGAVPMGVNIVDMETAAVARKSEEAGVPFIALRAVSDTADGSATDDGFAHAAATVAEATVQFLEHLALSDVDR